MPPVIRCFKQDGEACVNIGREGKYRYKLIYVTNMWSKFKNNNNNGVLCYLIINVSATLGDGGCDEAVCTV